MATKTQEHNPQSSAGATQRKLQEGTHAAAKSLQQYSSHYVAEPAQDIFAMLRDYAKDRPDVAAVWCFGLGAIVGWKLRG